MSDAIEALVLSAVESETKKDGLARKVTLLLPNDTPEHPFRGLVGERIAIAVARIHDDESAVAVRPADGGAPQALANDGDKPGRRPFHTLPRSQQAAIKCGDEAFQTWLAAQAIMARTGLTEPDHMLVGISPDNADRLVKRACHITSKRELDTDPAAGLRWGALLAEFEADTGRMAERR